MFPLALETHPHREVTFALSYSLLVSLPLMRSAGLWHIGGLLPPQALTKLVHLRGHVLPGTVDTVREGRRGSGSVQHSTELRSCSSMFLYRIMSKNGMDFID